MGFFISRVYLDFTIYYIYMQNINEQTEYYLNFDHNEVKSMSDYIYMDFYKWLIKEIKQHNYLYYTQNQSVVTDAEYDKLFDLLVYCENIYADKVLSDSPTQSLSDQLDIQTEFSKASHDTALLSLQKAYTAEDLQDRNDSNVKNLIKMWLELDKSDNFANIYDLEYTIEPKYDGISVELIYIDGVFVQAITRWDGLIWEDITINVMTIPTVPKKLNDDSIWKRRFRGEIMMTKSEFDRVNQQRSVNWEALFANPRNAASGTAKQLDPNVTASRNLICYVYEEL